MIYIPRELHFAGEMKREFNYGKQALGRICLSAAHFRKEKNVLTKRTVYFCKTRTSLTTGKENNLAHPICFSKVGFLPRIFWCVPLEKQGIYVHIQHLICKMLFLNPALWTVFGIILPWGSQIQWMYFYRLFSE